VKAILPAPEVPLAEGVAPVAPEAVAEGVVEELLPEEEAVTFCAC